MSSLPTDRRNIKDMCNKSTFLQNKSSVQSIYNVGSKYTSIEIPHKHHFNISQKITLPLNEKFINYRFFSATRFTKDWFDQYKFQGKNHTLVYKIPIICSYQFLFYFSVFYLNN